MIQHRVVRFVNTKVVAEGGSGGSGRSVKDGEEEDGGEEQGEEEESEGKADGRFEFGGGHSPGSIRPRCKVQPDEV